MHDSSKRSLIGLLVCMVVVLAWFSPWWIGGKNLAPLDLLNQTMRPWRAENLDGSAKNHFVADGADQYLVYRMLAAESYRKEGWVGWNSLSYGGTAQYANTMALYYDWTMQLHRWLDFWPAWHLGLMLQVMIAAGGMFLFLRGRSVSSLWACCGALAYAANSQFVAWIYHRWALGAFCWVPWILWAIDRSRQGKGLSWSLVPVFIGMAFLGGTLQHAALVVLCVVAAWIEDAIKGPRRIGIQSRLLGRYLLWGLLGGGLAAMMFLPCVEGFLTTNRLGIHTGLHGRDLDSIYPLGRLQPIFNLLAYPLQVFPSILGRCDSFDLLKMFKSELFYVAYMGSLPVLIAFLAPWRRNSPLLARLLIGFGLLLPLTPLVRFLYQRLYLLFIIGGILAFVHFMESASREARLRVFKFTGWLGGLAVGGWLVLSLVLYFNPGWTEQLRAKVLTAGAGSSFGFFGPWMEARTDRFIGDLFIWSPQQALPLLLFAAALVGLRWTASTRDAWNHKGALLVAMAVLGEVTLFGARWVVWTDLARDPLFPSTPESEALQAHVGREGRVTTLVHRGAHMALTPFVPNTLSPYGIATIRGYDSIVPDGMLLPNEDPSDARKLGRLAVSHLITWPGNSEVPHEWRLLWESPSMLLYENPLVMPRYVGWSSDIEKDAFFSGGNPRTVEVRETTGMENSRLLEVPAGVRWVRIAENAETGWEYRGVGDADWTPVEEAADSSMLLEVSDPAAGGNIEMRYAPPLRKLGFLVSGGSLAMVLIAGMMVGTARWRGRRALAGGSID